MEAGINIVEVFWGNLYSLKYYEIYAKFCGNAIILIHVCDKILSGKKWMHFTTTLPLLVVFFNAKHGNHYHVHL